MSKPKSRPPTPKAQLAAFLSRFPAGIVTQAGRCLAKLRRTFPGAYELAYDYPQSVVVAFGVTDRGYEALVALSVFPHEIRLYFDKALPDPQGLLGGTGTKVRSLVLKSAADLDHADIRGLIKAAIKHAGATFPPTGPTRLVIKSKAKPRKPKQARSA